MRTASHGRSTSRSRPLGRLARCGMLLGVYERKTDTVFAAYRDVEHARWRAVVAVRTTPAAGQEVLLGRIATALKQLPGTVLVTGHSDSSPIRTVRFLSNWHLSQERAEVVQALLVAQGLPAGRVRAVKAAPTPNRWCRTTVPATAP